MGLLTRQAILAASDIKTETVAVPEWGGEVMVRGLTGAEVGEYQGKYLTVENNQMAVHLAGMREDLVARSCVDENGKLLFSPDDAYLLGTKSSGALDRVFQVAQRLSGLDIASQRALAKNSGSALTGASSSG